MSENDVRAPTAEKMQEKYFLKLIADVAEVEPNQ